MIVYREISSVERELGISAKTLYGLSNNLNAHYRKVKIPKKDGSFRTLSVPDEILKTVQRSIAEKLLAYEPISQYARAYRTAYGIEKNAFPHVSKPKLLKLDINGFFDGIMYSSVKEKVFPSEKYSEPIRILLSMLCYFNDSLPQGAPSSPVITNIIMRDFDITVGEWCEKRDIAYTRYCDDMTFSGDFDEKAVIDFVSDKLYGMGLFLNRKKTCVVSGGRRQTVTGIVVNSKLNIASDYKRKIRSDVFYCRKFGVENHLEHIGCAADPKKYLAGLMGRINHVLHICPDSSEFIDYKNTVSELINEYNNKL